MQLGMQEGGSKQEIRPTIGVQQAIALQFFEKRQDYRRGAFHRLAYGLHCSPTSTTRLTQPLNNLKHNACRDRLVAYPPYALLLLLRLLLLLVLLLLLPLLLFLHG